MILGDDTVDSCNKVYTTYIETITMLGVEISMSKCTTSTSGSGDFAKRLFRKHVEVTGVPVHLLQNMQEMPENFMELTRMMEERNYRIEKTQPVICDLINKMPHGIGLNV
jgi:hypothetical protein